MLALKCRRLTRTHHWTTQLVERAFPHFGQFGINRWAETSKAGMFLAEPTRTEIIIMATCTQNVLGEKGRYIREMTAVVQKRFGFAPAPLSYTPSRARLAAWSACQVDEVHRRLMIHSGDPCNVYVDTAICHVLLRKGVLGVKVKTMLLWGPNVKIGPNKPLSDNVSIVEPNDETMFNTPAANPRTSGRRWS
ncbi:40S ribosomal protein S3-like [Culex pipiens pallens]|uniref:40S ribosomal protein S3-like n=1 Tax=Culex pipiens pallens TaxID=42434 RepID=UPI0019539DC2|nr:40S ribosomal protein S3-like [Culex pipiens pallens]XP_039444915.1 40S ribosomal protein S3-like [Culex pipiens pallens]